MSGNIQFIRPLCIACDHQQCCVRWTFRWLKFLEVNGAGDYYKLCNQYWIDRLYFSFENCPVHGYSILSVPVTCELVGFGQLFPTSHFAAIFNIGSGPSRRCPSSPSKVRILPATSTLLISWLYCSLLIVAMLCHLYSTTPPAYFVNCYSTFRICDSESGFWLDENSIRPSYPRFIWPYCFP